MDFQSQHSRNVAPTQVWDKRVKRVPTEHARTVRTDLTSVVTSSFGGVLMPLKMIPLLREDGARTSRFTCHIQMAETANMLLNPVRVSVMSYFVPKLAMSDRFKDMGTIDRSYNGQVEQDGTTVVPWFLKKQIDEPADIEKALGIHYDVPTGRNSDYTEAYNAVWNYIAANRSPSLTPRGELDGHLAPAFWEHTQMKHVVPNFDDAMIEGVVPISFTGEAQMPVKSADTLTGVTASIGFENANGEDQLINQFTSQAPTYAAPGTPVHKLFTELTADGFELTLANINLARETAAWSRMRAQHTGVSEEWMIDQLLAGIRVRDEELNHPILIDHQQTIVGMTQRYATDATNLDKSLTDGRTSVQVMVGAPRTSCGGVICVVGQVLPEMVYERQRDYYASAMTVDDLPNRTRDELDPQPVDLVTNKEVDTDHSLPDDLFGYQPLNAGWVRQHPNVGGLYYRNAGDAWNEYRNRIWSTEVTDPELGPDFYLSETISHEVFASSTTDPFEWWLSGACAIEGNTYFGPALLESMDDYDNTLAQVPTARLKGDGTDTAT